MIRLVADHDFNDDVLTGLTARSADVSIVRVREVGLAAAEDPAILEWAAAEGRVLLTHDRSTMIGYAYERVAAGRPMPGVVAVRQRMPIGQAIEEILLLIECSLEDELEGQVRYLPL